MCNATDSAAIIADAASKLVRLAASEAQGKKPEAQEQGKGYTVGPIPETPPQARPTVLG